MKATDIMLRFYCFLCIFALSGTHNRNHYADESDTIMLGHETEFVLPVYMNYKGVENNVTSAFIKAEWDSTHFDFVSVEQSNHWDSLGFVTVENRLDVGSGLYQVAYASVDSLDCDTLMFKISLKSKSLNAADTIKFVGQFNENVNRVEQNNRYVIDESLPVEMVSFEAVGNYSGASISWSTGYEIGSSHFDIYYIPMSWDYRSGLWNMEDAILAGSIESLGNSATGNSYTEFVSLQPGTYTFRIVQVDLSGNETVYNGNIFSVLGEDMTLEYWPNPVGDFINIEMYSPHQTHVSLVLYNIIGSQIGIVYEGGIIGRYKMIQNVSHIPNGVYFLVAELTNKNVVKKIVVNK